jgi:hypothetical protein
MSSAVLTPELRDALARRPGEPLRVIDPVTNTTYVLVAAELFDELTAVNTEASAGAAGPNGDAAAAWGNDFPAVGTPEWGRMNRVRANLIRKKLRGELTEAEQRQYEWLQRRTLEALDAAFPRSGAGGAGSE